MTEVPTEPEVGFSLKMAGPDPGSKITQLLESPLTVTSKHPTPAPLGTVTTMLVAFQLVGVATVPLNVTLLAPWVAPNPVPVIVTEVPGEPD